MTSFLSKIVSRWNPMSNLPWLLGLRNRSWLPQMLAVEAGVPPIGLRGETAYFPVPHSVMAQGYLKIRYSGNICTREVGKGYSDKGFFLSRDLVFFTSQVCWVRHQHHGLGEIACKIRNHSFHLCVSCYHLCSNGTFYSASSNVFST